MAFPQNRSNAIAMPLDYLNEASDEVQRLFTRLDDVERTLREASEEHHPMIGEERYLTGEEVCTRLHLSPRTLQTLRDRRQIPFTVLGNRLLLYPESGIRNHLIRGLFLCIFLPPAHLRNYRQESAIAPRGETKRQRVPLSSKQRKNHRP